MRHRVVKKKLGRSIAHRKSMAKNMAGQLIENEKIVTTLAKAKYIRPKVEKLITKAKKTADDNDKVKKFNTVKELKSKLHSDKAVRKLVDDLAERFKDRPGGYTRIVKLPSRDGDKAPQARIELVQTKKTDKTKDSKNVEEKKAKKPVKGKNVGKTKETGKKSSETKKETKTKSAKVTKEVKKNDK